MSYSINNSLQSSNASGNDEERLCQILETIGANKPEQLNVVQVEMDEFRISEINKTLSTVKSSNTKKTYIAPIKNYTKWSITRYGNDLVDGKKLLMWLHEEVFNIKQKNGAKLSYSTVRVYISAICDLYARQKADFKNSAPNPRTAAIRLACSWYQKELCKEKKEKYVDRGIGTREGYDLEELIKYSTVSFNKKNCLKYRLAQFLCHFLLLRGDNVRKAEFADLDTITFSGGSHIGASSAGIRLLVLVIRESKTNTNNRLQYSAVARHRDYRICTVGALAFYLFDMMHTAERPVPFFDLSTNKAWFDLKIIPNKNNPAKEMLYETHAKAIKSLFNEAGINPGKWTHSGRGSGARLAELNGAHADSIRRLGHWNDSDSMTSSYLLNLPMDVIKVMAGFSPGQDYQITRSSITPSTELQKLIWPEIEDYQKKLDNKEVESSIALKSFLNVLKYLRVVFLQDSVLLKQQFQENRVFGHPIFKNSLYLEFEKNMLAHESAQAPIEEENLVSSIPTLKNKINEVYKQVVERDRHVINVQNENFLKLNSMVLNKITPIENEIKKIGQKMDKIIPSLINKERMSTIEQQNTCALSLIEAAKNALTNNNIILTHDVSSEDINQLSEDNLNNLEPIAEVEVSPLKNCTYILSDTITTVEEVWNEYNYGIFGNPPVKLLETLKWYNNHESKKLKESQRKYHSRRSSIYKSIIFLIDSKGMSEQEAVSYIESIKLSKSFSLYQLQNYLLKNKSEFFS